HPSTPHFAESAGRQEWGAPSTPHFHGQASGNRRGVWWVWSSMNTVHADAPAAQKSLRLWPGVLALVLQWVAWLVVPVAFPEAMLYAVLGGVGGGLLVVVLWWLLFSRAPWSERVGV